MVSYNYNNLSRDSRQTFVVGFLLFTHVMFLILSKNKSMQWDLFSKAVAVCQSLLFGWVMLYGQADRTMFQYMYFVSVVCFYVVFWGSMAWNKRKRDNK